MIGLEKSFRMMYSNIGRNSRETVPLSRCKVINLKFDSRLGIPKWKEWIADDLIWEVVVLSFRVIILP